MTDLKDMCLLGKEELRYIHKALLNSKMTFASGANPDIASKLTKQALDQDLSGMVVVPVEATEAVIKAGEEAYSEILKYLTENNIYHADKDKQIDYVFVAKSARYKAMIAAAPKLGK